MFTVPDYTKARAQAGFTWQVSSSQSFMRGLSDVPIRDFYLEVEACAEAYRVGRKRQEEIFGDVVPRLGLATPHISYGHVNCLGSELLFPEGGEVGHTHIYNSLAEGIKALKQSVDWLSAGMAPYYLRFRERLQELFPGESVSWGFGSEGPLTTAYELRGEGFFMDIYDEPALAKEFLGLIVQSVLDYERVRAALHNNPFPHPHSGGMADDIASFIPPRLYPEFVLPFWEQYFQGVTTGIRTAHVEDLRPEQLPFLEAIGLSHYDPSISPRLTPKIIAERCRVPFTWRLESFHMEEMEEQEIEDFVFIAAADGASAVSFILGADTCDEASIRKTFAFIRAAKEAKQLLEEGMSREQLRERASEAGRTKLWESWCGYLGPNSTRGAGLQQEKKSSGAWGMKTL